MEHTITAIRAQKRNPQRVAIDLDGQFAFGLSRIIAAWLYLGKVLTDADIESLQQSETLELAYYQALRLLSYRPRTAMEIQRKLQEKGFAEAVVTQTQERLSKNGLLDDSRFAQDWVDNRTAFRPRSHKALAIELRRKGVADEVISQALVEAGDEETLAYQAARRKASRLAGCERREFRNSLVGFLARRGFAYSVIAPVVDRLWSELQLSPGPGNILDNGEMEEEE